MMHDYKVGDIIELSAYGRSIGYESAIDGGTVIAMDTQSGYEMLGGIMCVRKTNEQTRYVYGNAIQLQKKKVREKGGFGKFISKVAPL